MQITKIEPIVVHVNHRGDWIFVHVHTDAGIIGLGEASHAGNDALVLAALDYFGNQLTGADPLQIEGHFHMMSRLNGGRVSQTALSAIEQALWDILGQHLGVPVHSLFGGALRQNLRLYANINRHVRDRSPDGFARAASQAVVEGFTAIKLAPFDEVRDPHHVRTGPDAGWRAGVARVQAVRDAIGPTVELAVDCHSRFDKGEALQVAAALAECDLYWFEEPVHHDFVEDLAAITRSIAIPTASAESIFGMRGFAPLLTARVVDVLMPDVKHNGGLLATKNIAAAAQMHNLLIAPHNPAGPVATAATAQVISTCNNFSILEFAWGEADWRATLLEPAEQIEMGHLVLSQQPGIGHRLNMDVVAEHRRHDASADDSSKVRPQ